MESTEQLRQEITHLEDLQSIIKTMKALSAANIHQYERATKSLKTYTYTIELGLKVLLEEIDINDNLSPIQPKAAPIIAIIFGSDIGLCGRFNNDLVEFALKQLQDDLLENKENVIFLAIGSRVEDLLEQEGFKLANTLSTPSSANGITNTVQQLLKEVERCRMQYQPRQIKFFYNKYSSSAVYESACAQLMPLDPVFLQKLKETEWTSNSLPFYTIDQMELLDSLLREYFLAILHNACANSQASENSNRLVMMKSAEDKLEEKIKVTTMHYRRNYQQAITEELLDIVSGFETLKTTVVKKSKSKSGKNILHKDGHNA